MSQSVPVVTPHGIERDAVAADSPPSRGARIAGRALSAIAVLFLIFDATIKLVRVPEAVSGTMALGYPESVILPLAIIQVVCLILYVVPRTSFLGAVLWTGYLGGAVATHVRLANPLLSHILFPTYIAALLWAGLWLREARLRELVPFRRASH